MAPPTHADGEFATVSETIKHLDGIAAGTTATTDPLHKSSGLSQRNLDRIRSSKPGGTWRDWDDSLRAACHVAGKRTYVSERIRADAMGPTSSDHNDAIPRLRQWALRPSRPESSYFSAGRCAPPNIPRGLLVRSRRGPNTHIVSCPPDRERSSCKAGRGYRQVHHRALGGHK